MENIKPIETVYNGYRFRSRLEARWAVFFDRMNIKYQYETDGFIGYGNIAYLPDFYFPDYGIYGEVKGTDKQLFEVQEKISGAIDFNSTPVSKGLLLFGPIPYPRDGRVNQYQIEGCMLRWDKGVTLSNFLIQSLNEYGRFLPMKNRGGYSSWPQIPERTSVEMKIINLDPNLPSLLDNALSLARCARFDHGEHGYSKSKEDAQHETLSRL